MKNPKTRNRLAVYFVMFAAATAICWDIAVATLDIELGTFRYESEFNALSGATTQVSIVTSDYDDLTNPIERTINPSYEQIEDMVGKAIELQGGLGWVIDKGDVVMIKVNLVGGTSLSGEGENTDVRVVKALIRHIHQFTEGDVEIKVAEGTARTNDDPADPNSVWGHCGYIDLLTDPMMDGINFSLLNLNQTVDDLIEIDLGSEGTSAIQGSKYYVHRAEVYADKYIAVPVLKIHNTGITNALKLQVGTAPGCYYGYNKERKGSRTDGLYHNVDHRVWTTEMIVDLCNIADIDFVVVDAIMCLEVSKNASTDHQVRFNTILAGSDPVAVDHVSAKLMGLNPDDVAHITLAEKVGLGTNDPDHINMVGVPLSQAMKKVKKSQHEDGKFGQSNRTWTLSRVFEGAGLNKVNFNNETAIEPIPGEGGWSEPVYFFDDRIDLYSFYEGKTDITTYAFTYFKAEKAQEAELWLGSHEGIQVCLNGEEVYLSNSVNVYGDSDRGEFKKYIHIREGRNTLLVKTVNNFGDYSFALNICEVESDPDYFGNRVDGLKFYLDASGTTDTTAPDTLYYELWDISNLETIGGHSVTSSGDPQVVSTELGDAVEFDGDGDRLLVDFNPIMNAKEFTVELVFKPKACYPENTAPRFVHIQNPDDPDAKRVMIELRVDENNQCYMDGFIKTDAGSLTLINETLVHSTEKWQHVAITLKDSIFTTFFNGIEELSGILRYDSMIVDSIGKTSLGARMNEEAYYAGLMKTLKVSHACLKPEDFILPPVTDTTITELPVAGVEIGMDVFPVPANRYMKVKMEPGQYMNSAEVLIGDLSGRTIFRKAYPRDGGELTIDTSDFMVGVYIVTIQSSGQSVFRRVVVIH
ncbi:MAG: DUF362 domain-containing protein [Bacteroidota bacterium]